MKTLILVIALLSGNSPLALRQEAVEQPDQRAQRGERVRRLRENAAVLFEKFDALGPWEEHYGYMIDATERIYRRNGWTSEPDQFSLDLIREVEALPPHAVAQRFATLTQMFGDRYLLSEEQEMQLGRIVMRESFGLFARHSDRIMSYAGDVLSTRANGEAVTPEKVARWMELSHPVYLDARRRMTDAAEEFSKQLEPEQRELLQRDLDGANARLDQVEDLAEGWSRGKWQPADWGLDEDPIQLAGEARLEAERAAAADPAAAPGAGRGKDGRRTDRDTEETQPTSIADEEAPDPGLGRETVERAPELRRPRPDTGLRPPDAATADGSLDEWARYVRDFIQRYKLEEAQRNRAWAIHRDVKSYGDRIRRRIEPTIAELAARRDRTETDETRARFEEQIGEARAPLDRIFEQMKRRLDRLPTRAQRRAAEQQAPVAPDAPQVEARRAANRRAEGP